MRVLMCSSGSGGHLTPLRYVAESVKKLQPGSKIAFIGQKGDSFAPLAGEYKRVDHFWCIRAGKYRRYPRPWWKSLLDIPTLLLNVRDGGLTFIGFFQALVKIRRFKPDVLLAKGGAVSVPVGLAASLLKVPLVTHDSDVLPGLSTRLLGRYAKYCAVGRKQGEYPYEEKKLKYTGIPINPLFFKRPGEKTRRKLKKRLKLKQPAIFVMPGSLGAATVNRALISSAERFTKAGYSVAHICGKKHYQALREEISDEALENGYQLIGFIEDQRRLIDYYYAADYVIARAGATGTAELAAMGKPAVLVPAQQLRDQLANAEQIESADAAIVINDKELSGNPRMLFEAVERLRSSKALADKLGKSLGKFAEEDAAEKLAKLLIKAGGKR